MGPGLESPQSGHPACRWGAAALALGLMCLAGGCAPHLQSIPSGPLTTIEQVSQLTPEAVAAQVPVRLHGTVTYYDGAAQLLLMQDATDAVRIEGAPLASLGLDRGTALDFQGTVANGGSSPEVTYGSARLGDRHSPLPTPVRPTAQDLASGRFQYHYVQLEGVVKSAAMDRAGRFSLVLHALGWDVQVRVRNQSAFDYHSLIDAVVRARGDLYTSLDARGAAVGVKLWVTDPEDVQVVQAAPAAASLPVRTVRSLLSPDRTLPSGRRIRLNGSVSVEAGRVTLQDSTGTVPIHPAPSESIGAGPALDLLCFAGEEQGALPLTACTVWDQARQQHRLAPLPVLTTVSQVKGLSEDEARRAYPVHLRGVVTYHNPVATNTFLQDQTGGIYVFFDGQAEPTLHAGDLAELDGFSGPGQFAPVVRGTSVRVVGRQALPEPLRVDMERLFAGIADSTWVEAEGIVHSIHRQVGGHSILGVNWGVHNFSAYVSSDTELPDSLLDSHVRLLGVCGTRFNFKRQILGMQLFVPDASFIRVEGGAPLAPPLRKIDQLLQFSSASDFGRRSRVRGVVILTELAGPTYVSDSTGGVLIQHHAPADLSVGDSVEVTGLPVAVSGLFNPVFREADVRKLGHAVAPEPVLVTATDILEEGYDAQLVQLDAVLVDQGAAKGNQVLLLQAGDRLFEARIDHQRLPPLEKGTVLRVTGIPSIQTYELQQTVLPQTFSIMLRSPEDVVVLQPAPWLTAARTFRLLGLMCAVALLAFVWVVVLRRRVRLQTAELLSSRQMLQLVLDNIPQRVFWKDREGRFLGCNKALAAQAGVLRPLDVLGKTDYDFKWKAAADLYVADDREVIESGVAKIGYEEVSTGEDGGQRWVRTSKVPLPGSIGGVIGVLGISEDITESKRIAEKLERYSVELAETNEELRRFTQIVSHDLRAPLVSLKGFSTDLRQCIDTLRRSEEALLASLAEPERPAVAEALRETIPEDLGFIESSVTRMDHLTGALLRLARAGHREFKMEELDAAALLQETVGSLAHQIHSRNIAVEIGPLPRIASDRAAIEQIFGNLLDNAIKYLDPQRPGRIEVFAEETAGATVFHVRDTGRGIAEEDMDKVFAPFRRAGPQDVPGEGMGLAFVRTLLHRLGGRIECRSELGVGTTFSFMLPREN